MEVKPTNSNVDHAKLKQPQWPLQIVYTAEKKQLVVKIGDEVRPPASAEEELLILDRNFSVLVNSVAKIMGFLTRAGIDRQEVEKRVFVVLDGGTNIINDTELPDTDWMITCVELLHSKVVKIHRSPIVKPPADTESQRQYMFYELRILSYCLVNQIATLINAGIPYNSLMSATRQVIDHYLLTGATSGETKRVEVKMYDDNKPEQKPKGEFWVIKLVNRTEPNKTGYVIGINDKGLMVATQKNILPTEIKQFESEGEAYRYIRDNKLGKDKNVTPLIIKNTDLIDTNNSKNVRKTDGNEFYLQAADGQKVYFEADTDQYYLKNGEAGFCIWSKTDAEEAARFVEEATGQKISVLPINKTVYIYR